MLDCENCSFYQRCMEQHEDPDDALRALEEIGCCDICFEDSMQE